jgi:hypothetical protein
MDLRLVIGVSFVINKSPRFVGPAVTALQVKAARGKYTRSPGSGLVALSGEHRGQVPEARQVLALKLNGICILGKKWGFNSEK